MTGVQTCALPISCFVKLGAGVQDAMFVQNFSWAFSLLVILERFSAKLTGSKLAGRIAPALLFFSGGLGFVWFFKDFWESGRGVYDFLWHLPKDYTIGDHFRWGNSMVVLFITQRSLLLGMPLTVLVLGYLWRIFAADVELNRDGQDKQDKKLLVPFLIGLIAGTLPLIHLHSLAALFVVTTFLFVMQPGKWKTWIVFGLGVAVITIPELLWSMSGSATETAKFFDWHFGWDKRDDNFFWFWLKNTGVVIPVLAAGIYLIFSTQRVRDAEEEVKRQKAKGKTEKSSESSLSTFHSPLLLFYIPFLILFIISNLAKLAPWEWDNIKILIYWYVGSIPLMAYAIA